MDNPAFMVLAVVLMIFGITVGNKVGHDFGRKADDSRTYWLYNLAAFAGSVVLFVIIGVAGFPLLQGLVIGLLSGSVVGLKMGYGEAQGPWRKFDDALNLGDARRRAAAEKKAAAANGVEPERTQGRRARRERPLISVDSKQNTATNADTDKKR